MSDAPRDWDKEMAEIDRAMAKMPAGQPAAPAPLPRGATVASAAPATHPAAAPLRRGAIAATWVLVLLVVAASAALPFWPYARSCGWGLALYLAVLAVVFIVALSALTTTWRHRRGLAHTLVLLASLWLLALAALEVLPRIGYAAHGATWVCPAAAPPAANP